MMNFLSEKKTPVEFISDLDLGDFEATWAGEYPPAQGVALGAEDGRILLAAKDGNIVGRAKAESDEAINGLAFLPNWMGISTRAEICFVDVTPGQEPTFVPSPYGAHGVIVGPDEQFIAPLGTNGLLFFKPQAGEELPLTISRPRARNLYIYRVISMIGSSGQRVVAAATRRDGIAAMPFDLPERGLHTLTFDGLDAIDLCQLGPSSLSVAALGKDGTIMMCRDVIEDTMQKHASMTIRFADIKGTAYRILNAHGALIVATSRAVYFLGGMLENFSQGITEPVTIQEFPIKAIDANIVNEHWLIIVTSRGVLKLDLRKLRWDAQHDNGHQRQVMATSLSPAFMGQVEPMVAA